MRLELDAPQPHSGTSSSGRFSSDSGGGVPGCNSDFQSVILASGGLELWLLGLNLTHFTENSQVVQLKCKP